MSIKFIFWHVRAQENYSVVKGTYGEAHCFMLQINSLSSSSPTTQPKVKSGPDLWCGQVMTTSPSNYDQVWDGAADLFALLLLLLLSLLLCFYQFIPAVPREILLFSSVFVYLLAGLLEGFDIIFGV